MAGRSNTGEHFVIVGCRGKFLKAGRGDIGIVCNLMVGAVGVGEEGAGEWGRSLKEVATSRDIFGISTVGENKDNLAKCIDGEETDVGDDAGAGAFFVFLDLRRGGRGGGGMMAESGVQ